MTIRNYHASLKLDLDMESAWIIWLILCAAFIIAEIFTASFFAGPIGFSCLVAAILAHLEFSGTIQLLAFSITSIVLIVAIRPIWIRMLDGDDPDLISGPGAYIGETGQVIETVDSAKGTGRIRLGSESWVAISEKNIIIEAGARATVVRMDGTKAVISVSENP